MAAAGAAVNNINKKAVFKNCDPFTSYITKINNTQVGYTEDIDIIMSMYNYLKTSGSLWQYYRDEPALDDNSNSFDFLGDNNNSNSFKFKQQITGKQETAAQKMLK